MERERNAISESKDSCEFSNCVLAESPLVITGMHRSATSFAASLFHNSGISFGDELVPADAGNLRGHFEDVRFQEFHRGVLRENALSEHGWILDQQVHPSEQRKQEALEIVKSAARRPVWGWKDPRTTLFLQFWQKLLPRARYIFLYRAAWDVADSLYRRNAPHDQIFSETPEFAIEVWTHYNQRLLSFFDAHPAACILVNADSLIRDPGMFQDLIEERYSVALRTCASETSDPQLYNSQISATSLPEVVCREFPAVPRIWEDLERRSDLPASDSQSNAGGYSAMVPVDVPTNIRDWADWRRSSGASSRKETKIF